MTDLASCFEQFTDSAFRLEARRLYVVPDEAARLDAFRRHLPRPERSVRTSPWLARIAATTAAGKTWQRARVLGRPLSEYERYQLIGYQESAVAGDVIRIADRSQHPELAGLTRDFWLFDAGTDHALVAFLDYQQDGRFRGASITDNLADIETAEAARDLATRHSVPLAEYLAERGI